MAEQQGRSSFDESMRQSLSALMDGEASDLELRRILARSDDDSELRQTWAKYHTISRAMRSEDLGVTTVDLSTSIADLIADEPAYSGTGGSNSSFLGRILSNGGKVAIAASVAMVAVFAANQVINTQNPAAPAAVVADTGSAIEAAPAANLPMGYGTTGLSARTVSTDGASSDTRRTVAPMIFVPRTEAPVADPAIEAFLRQVMAEHAKVGTGSEAGLPFERVPRTESE